MVNINNFKVDLRLKNCFYTSFLLLYLKDTWLIDNFSKEYLSKFGWVKPSVWSELSPSLRQLLLYKTPTEHSFPTSIPEYRESKINSYDLTQLLQSYKTQKVTEATYVEALKNFQNENGLQVNGILDEATSFVMQQPR